MSSSALETQGVVFAIGDAASPEVFNTIPEVMSFDGPGGSASVIDVSDLASSAREKRMGLADEGQFSFEIAYIPSNTYHTLLRTRRSGRTLTNFRITLTDSPQSVISFSGYVLEFRVSGGVDDFLRANVTIEISGSVTVA